MATENCRQFCLQSLEEGTSDVISVDILEQKKPYKCLYEDCTASFNRPYRLNQHIKSCHEGERPFKCAQVGCDKRYTNNSHLARHMKEAHTTLHHKALFKCNFPGCGRQIRHLGNMKRHIDRWHDTSRKFKYACDKCDKSYPKQLQLDIHTFQHTGIAAYRCPNCNRSYLKERLLKKHQTHCQIEQYECKVPGCPESRSIIWSKRGIRDHMWKFHPKTCLCAHCPYKTNKKSQLRIHMCTHFEFYQREVFNCPVPDCPRFYFHKKNMKVHVRVAHEDKRLPCPKENCKKTFIHKGMLRNHMKLHEPGYKSCRVYKKGRERKQRKDTDIPRRSWAVKLSGIETTREYEKNIVQVSNSDLILKDTNGWVIMEEALLERKVN